MSTLFSLKYWSSYLCWQLSLLFWEAKNAISFGFIMIRTVRDRQLNTNLEFGCYQWLQRHNVNKPVDACNLLSIKNTTVHFFSVFSKKTLFWGTFQPLLRQDALLKPTGAQQCTVYPIYETNWSQSDFLHQFKCILNFIWKPGTFTHMCFLKDFSVYTRSTQY